MRACPPWLGRCSRPRPRNMRNFIPRRQGCRAACRRQSSMSRQRTRAPSRRPSSPTAILPSPGSRRRSTRRLGDARRKARTGIRLCAPAMTNAPGFGASRSIASPRVPLVGHQQLSKILWTRSRKLAAQHSRNMKPIRQSSKEQGTTTFDSISHAS
jgi:hypothetical protein